ncbi:MAG TPA: DNA N-6-adenine-methyltransferase, partial [Geobacteraceae bacterium]
PAASHENRLTKTYSTIEGTFFLENYWSSPEKVSSLDGLNYPWEGKRVFLNPPYSRPLLAQFVHKMVSERDKAAIIVALVKVDTSTGWWRTLEEHSHVEYLRRVAYLDEQGIAKPAATFSSAIVLLRPSEPRALRQVISS